MPHNESREQHEVTFDAHDFHESGILYEIGFVVKKITLDPKSDRVVFTFLDPDTKALDTLRQHRQGVLQMRTIKLVEAFRWARRQTFSVRDGGKPRGPASDNRPTSAPRPGGSGRFALGSRGAADAERDGRGKGLAS